MLKKLLCSILSLVLLFGMLTCFPAAEAASALVSSDKLVEYIKSVEGFRAYPYWDYGQYTVGYGTRCPSDKYEEYSSKGISEEAAVELLKNELVTTENYINKFIDDYSLKINQHQFDALITFTYNCGSGWLRETTGTLNQAIRKGATGNELISALALWSTAGGEFILLNRRLSEAYMYLNGEYLPYNKYEQPYPDSYRWVFLSGCGGEPEYKIYAYDSTSPSAVPTGFKSTPAGYTFEGWYTASGTKITTLDSSLSKDQVLYARWKNSSGHVISVNGDGPVNKTVTVTENEANLRTGPGTHSVKAGTVTAGTKLTITEIHTAKNYVWGRSSLGWIAMNFTDGGVSNSGSWVQDGGKWLYYLNGDILKNAWAADSSGNCYLGADGYMVTDRWIHDGNGWYYIDASGHAVTNTWKQDSHGWCYLGATGQMVKNQWAKDWKGLCYIGADGYMVTNGWAKKDGIWYYLGADGHIATNVWAQDSIGWCYLGADGKITVNAWLEKDGNRVYVNRSGYMVKNGWAKDGKSWYYLDSNGLITCSSWVNDGKGWCYLGKNGQMVVQQWVTFEDITRYMGADGYALINCWKDDIFLGSDGTELTEGWGHDGTGWFYLNPDKTIQKSSWLEASEGLRYVGEDGYALTNCWHEDFFLDADGIKAVSKWITYNDATYYIGSDGYRVTSDWVSKDGKWCYLDETGAAIKNSWLKKDQKWCYVGADGCMVTNGWAKDGHGMCYLGADGFMVHSRWVKDGVSWFYIGSNGYMLKDSWAKDSHGWCYLDSNGLMVYNAWKKDSKGWCYIGAYGYMVTNNWAKDSYGWCYLGADGYMLRNVWRQDSKGWCYVNAQGYMVINGWAKDSQGWYWMGGDGYPVKNTSLTIGDKKYHFNASGICTNP